MTASLHHAQPVLAAAINAGFRESGVQSLKNLNDPNAFPMVAIRSSGLSLSSIIGFAADDESNTMVVRMVSEAYLEVLVKLADERFRTNADRVARFRSQLLQSREGKGGHGPSDGWEDKASRRERMRKCGLEKRKEHQLGEEAQTERRVMSEEDDDDLLGGLKLDAD
jgi:tRNA wybutosine-synthesizing protein 3